MIKCTNKSGQHSTISSKERCPVHRTKSTKQKINTIKLSNIITNNLEVHASHCCSIHGCKYNEVACPVETGKTNPTYPHNNGCEQCEFDKEENSFSTEEL